MGELDLDPGQRVKLEGRFKTQFNTDKKEAYRILRRSVGALSELTPLDIKTQVMLADMEQQLQEKYDKAIAQEKPQTYVEIANEIYRSGSGDLKRRELEESENNIKALLREYGINIGSITKENIDSLISDLEDKKAESYQVETLEIHKRKYFTLEQ
jgi:DNA-directed RNA polymerase